MAKKVERTAPGSKLDFRVTYDSGNKKWTNDRPGDGKGDPEERENLFNDLTVKRGIKRVQDAISAFAAGKKGPEAIQKAVEAFEVYAGVDAARTAVRAIYDAVKGKEGKLKEGAGMAKDHLNRNRKAMNREARIADRIARSLIAKKPGIELTKLNARSVARKMESKVQDMLDRRSSMFRNESDLREAMLEVLQEEFGRKYDLDDENEAKVLDWMEDLIFEYWLEKYTDWVE